MLPVTVYPDAEAVAIDFLVPHLTAHDPGVTIDVRGGGGRFVRVRRVGGIPLTPAHDNPTLDVLVWHDDDASRMALAQHVWAWLRAANNDRAGEGVLTYSSTLLAPRPMPDPADLAESVCMFTVSLIVRPAAA